MSYALALAATAGALAWAVVLLLREQANRKDD